MVMPQLVVFSKQVIAHQTCTINWHVLHGEGCAVYSNLMVQTKEFHETVSLPQTPELLMS